MDGSQRRIFQDVIHIFILHHTGAVTIEKPWMKGDGQIAAVQRLMPVSGMEHIGIAEQTFPCFQMIETVVHLIHHIAL